VNSLRTTAVVIGAHGFVGRHVAVALCAAGAPVIAVGRSNAERVQRATTLALRATVLYGVLALASVILLARPMVAVFVSDPVIASTARHALRIIALAFAAYGIAPLVFAYFQSVGKPKPSYLLSLGTLLAVKIPLVIALGRTGINGIWIGLAAGELASALIAMITLKLLDPGVHSSIKSTGGHGSSAGSAL
jgi:Na+-driven multidrug efflux pump